MSEATETPRKLSRQERALQYLLFGTTVPLKGGGGIVFPRGFPRIGYRLDEWQFDRYRAHLDQTMLNDRAKRRTRLAVIIFAIYLVVLALLVFGKSWLQATPFSDPRITAGMPVLALGAITALALIALRIVHRREVRFTQPLENAPRISRFAFLHHRALGMLASDAIRPTALHIWAFISCAALAIVILSDSVLAGFPVLRIMVITILLNTAARRIYLCWVYWSFRLKHGRAPTPADLEPVSLPDS